MTIVRGGAAASCAPREMPSEATSLTAFGGLPFTGLEAPAQRLAARQAVGERTGRSRGPADAAAHRAGGEVLAAQRAVADLAAIGQGAVTAHEPRAPKPVLAVVPTLAMKSSAPCRDVTPVVVPMIVSMPLLMLIWYST